VATVGAAVPSDVDADADAPVESVEKGAPAAIETTGDDGAPARDGAAQGCATTISAAATNNRAASVNWPRGRPN